MNDAEQKRFRFLCNESEVGRLDELRDFVNYCKQIQNENKDLERQVEKLKSQRATFYSRWVNAWDLNGAEYWAMTLGHVAILIAFVFSMIGAWHIVKPDGPPSPEAVLTNRYFLMYSTDRQVGACTQVMQEVIHGSSVAASQCFKTDSEALKYATELVNATGGTFLREEAVEVEKPVQTQGELK